MKYVFNIVLLGVFICLTIGCSTKWNYVDTGHVDGRFHGTMYEYFHSNPYDWDSTLVLIEKAGLVDLFDGKDPKYKEITFLGPTNHSIRRWMIENDITSLATLEIDVCREMILRHVIPGKFMRADIPFGTQANAQEKGEGGQEYVSVGGIKLWIYTFQGAYEDVAESGSIDIYIYVEEKGRNIKVASSNIEPDNGVVHSLEYAYTLGEL